MRFIQKWLAKLSSERAAQERDWEPATGEQLRQNVKRHSAEWLADEKAFLAESIGPNPPNRPRTVYYILEKLAQHALELAMIDWRAGVDPSPHLNEVRRAFDQARAAKPDLAPINPVTRFPPMVYALMGWKWPFEVAPPPPEQAKSAFLYMENWLVAGLHDPSCWEQMEAAPPVKNQFMQKCLDDYWALLTDQIDLEEGMARCIKNYDRRATHPTFKSIEGCSGGGRYNPLFVDYALAAIMRRRGLTSGSVHDWIWE